MSACGSEGGGGLGMVYNVVGYVDWNVVGPA